MPPGRRLERTRKSKEIQVMTTGKVAKPSMMTAVDYYPSKNKGIYMNKNWFGFSMAIAIALIANGCTRSLAVNYNAGFPDTAALQAKTKQKVAVLPFSDERSLVDKDDEKSKSYVGKQGVWKFGLGIDDKEYVPVASILQSLFVKEFNLSGYDAYALAKADDQAAYVLSGKIVTFEFENETGFVTVTSRRAVSLVLNLSKADGSKLLDNTLFIENDRENEGMGVLHSTNVDKLTNKALKKVIGEVLGQMKQKLAFYGNVNLKVTLNGKPMNVDALQGPVFAMH